MHCFIADFHIKINNIYEITEKRLKKYTISKNNDDEDIIINICEKDLIEEERADLYSRPYPYYESVNCYRKLASWIPLHNAFVLHAVAVDVGGVGVAFAAHSGTGKTTHMRLWQEYLGDKMVIVNGDKPIVRFFEDEPETPYAYGTPWNGKEGLGCNMRTPMKHICFIERAEENSCEPMESSEAIDLIFNQVYMPKDPLAVLATMQLINRFINSCSLWKIKCNMDISAAEVAYKTIFPEG